MWREPSPGGIARSPERGRLSRPDLSSLADRFGSPANPIDVEAVDDPNPIERPRLFLDPEKVRVELDARLEEMFEDVAAEFFSSLSERDRPSAIRLLSATANQSIVARRTCVAEILLRRVKGARFTGSTEHSLAIEDAFQGACRSFAAGFETQVLPALFDRRVADPVEVLDVLLAFHRGRPSAQAAVWKRYNAALRTRIAALEAVS